MNMNSGLFSQYPQPRVGDVLVNPFSGQQIIEARVVNEVTMSIPATERTAIADLPVVQPGEHPMRGLLAHLDPQSFEIHSVIIQDQARQWNSGDWR